MYLPTKIQAVLTLQSATTPDSKTGPSRKLRVEGGALGEVRPGVGAGVLPGTERPGPGGSVLRQGWAASAARRGSGSREAAVGPAGGTWLGQKHGPRRGRGPAAPGTGPGRTPPPPPPPARPGPLFILPGTQRLQEQHVIDNEPSAGQGLAIGSACKSRGWRVGAALQNKSLRSLRHPQAPKSQSPGVLPPVGRRGAPTGHPVLGGKVI